MRRSDRQRRGWRRSGRDHGCDPDQVEQVLFMPGGGGRDAVGWRHRHDHGNCRAGGGQLRRPPSRPRRHRRGRRPVSGGALRAAAGELLIMVSGPADPIARVHPLLDTLARSAPVAGPFPGDGQRMKLVNQLLRGVHIAAAAEALSFADSLGLQAAQCWQVLREGAAASFMFDDRGARMVAAQFDHALSTVDIFVKDMGLVSEAAAQSGAPIPLTAVARQLYEHGHELGMGYLDDSARIEVLRKLAPAAGQPRSDLRDSCHPRVDDAGARGRHRTTLAEHGRQGHLQRCNARSSAMTACAGDGAWSC